MDDQDRTDLELLRVIDGQFDQAARRAGDRLVCAPGCSDCCHGPFPITRLDVVRLKRGLARLDAESARRISCRAGLVVDRLISGFPGDLRSGRLAHDEMLLDRYFERHASLACPVLDPASGRCELYEHRPVSCRSYGPPMRFAGRATEPCPLCFRGATPEQVESCRIESDPDDLERSALERLGVPADEHWETLIAFVVAERPT